MSNSNYCTSCGAPIPSNQGSNSCSICYGDIDHGRDGYYRQWMEEQAQEQAWEKHMEEKQWEDQHEN